MRFRVVAYQDPEQWWHLWQWEDVRTHARSKSTYAFRALAWAAGLLGLGS